MRIWNDKRFRPRTGTVVVVLWAALACPVVFAQPTSGAYAFGVFRGSQFADNSASIWIVDSNGDHLWEITDSVYSFGTGGDIPVMGDWDFTGRRRMGTYRIMWGTGVWVMDMDDSRSWSSGDAAAYFGAPGDIPLTIPWTDGYLHIAVYRPSNSQVLVAGTCNCYDPSTTQIFPMINAQSGDYPVVVNLDGQGGRLAFWRPADGSWHIGNLGSSGQLTFDLNSPPIPVYQYGAYGDFPVAGDWTGTNSSIWNIGAYRNGVWIVDSNASHGYDGGDAAYNSFGGQVCLLGGFSTQCDYPVLGPWSMAAGGSKIFVTEYIRLGGRLIATENTTH